VGNAGGAEFCRYCRGGGNGQVILMLGVSGRWQERLGSVTKARGQDRFGQNDATQKQPGINEMTRNASNLIAATPPRSSSGHAESLQVIEPGLAEQPAVRRFDLALFLKLNEEYRAKPLVPAPRRNDPETLASRGASRARKLVERFDLKGKSVLEIGCGRGEVARALAAEHACRVVAIDIQPRADWAEPNGVEFLVADLTDGIPPELGEFDFIFASSVWEHVRHPYTMLERTKELLGPHGVFQLSANLYRGPMASHRYREVFFPWPHLLFEDDVFEDFYLHIGMKPARPAWVNHLTAAEYQRYFHLLGFSIQKLEYSIRPLDREFYQRFEDRLSRYPIFDLERDFIHVVLRPVTSRPAASPENSPEAAAQPERDRIGAAYLGRWGTQLTQQRARARIDWMAANAQGPRILDVGCSEGILALLLARTGRYVVGVDIELSAIAAARELLNTEPAGVRERVELRVADALTVDLSESAFDTVVLGEVIEHLADPSAMLDRAATLLKPEGQLVLTTPFGYFPHPDHRQEFRTTQLVSLLSARFIIDDLAVVDGYFRVRAHALTDPVLEERRAPGPYQLLVTTEEAAVVSQKHLYGQLKDLQGQLTLKNGKVAELSRRLRVMVQKELMLTEKIRRLGLQLDRQKREVVAIVQRRTQQAQLRLKQAQLRLKQAQLRLKQQQEGLRQELGRAVEKSLRSPFGAVRLPFRIAKAYRRARHRAAAELLAPGQLERTISHRDISSAFPPYPYPERAPRSAACVATILDEFSDACFRYEADLIRLTKEFWREQIERERPQFLFVESAWRGNRENWRGLIRDADDTLDNPLDELVNYCKAQAIPTVFWNKEDSPNFEVFIGAAAKFDYVFTSDANCIEQYHARLGHQRVTALPFAAQPAIHNPIGKVESDEYEIAFAGTWYGQKHEERGALLPILLDAATHHKLHIFDRMSGHTRNDHYKFPEKYAPFLRLALAYPNVLSAYRSFKVFLNVNSVTDSPTMFARRVFEILASSTTVISTASIGIEQMLGDVVSIAHDEEEARAELDKLLSDAGYRQRKSHLGYRKVTQQHTYAARFLTIVRALGLDVDDSPASPKVSVVIPLDDARWLENALGNVRRQKYADIEPLWIVKDGAASTLAERVMDACPAGRIIEVGADASLAGMLGRGIDAAEGALIAAFDQRDLYGPEFIGDLVLAFTYADAAVVGKAAYFGVTPGGAPVLHEPALRYRYVDRVLGTAWLARRELLQRRRIDQMLRVENGCPMLACGDGAGKMYSADPYNYLRCQAGEMTPTAGATAGPEIMI
jgi:2-polyprenyl-3-methyl-5-hydroxy-6-metoxy-1,4-benzoquinol methylase